MVKKDLYEKLRKDFPHLKNATVKGALDVIFDTIAEGLVQRKDTVIRGLGTFTTEERKMPKENFKTFTFDKAEKAETFICVKFFPSSGLKKRLNKDV